MMRKLAIGFAAAVIATGGATLSASAAYHGGGYHGGMTHHGGYTKGTYKPGYGQYGGKYHRPYYWRHHGPRYGYYRTYGTYYGGGGGSCWRWTPEGREWVCPRYSSGYSSYSREYYKPRYGHYYGHHYGRRGAYGRR